MRLAEPAELGFRSGAPGGEHGGHGSSR